MDTGLLIGAIIGILGLIIAIAAVLYALGLLKKGFSRTPGKEGVIPIKKSALKEFFLKLNKPKHPFQITEPSDTDLLVTLKVLDSKWIEILGGAWQKKTYKLWVLIDDTTKTVRVNELITEAAATMGATGAHFETSSFRGVQLWRKERGYRWGIKPDFSVGEIYNYKFNPSDLKEILRQIANDNGWAFEVVVSRAQASHPK